MDLKRFRLLCELDGQDRRLLTDFLQEQRVPKGQCIFREGDAASALVLVAKGRLLVESRREGEVGTLGPGSWFGAASLVTVGAREATLSARQTSTVLRLERTSMRQLLDEAPQTAGRVLEAIAGDLADVARRSIDAAHAVDRERGDP
ncbi:MAG: cyclic nucleotide-binding domain-containing protein [Myxococcota bacterium]